MYQQQAGAAGGMLKRHFMVIYGQLDELRERTVRMESNVAEMVLRMEGLNRKYSQLEGNRSQLAESERISHELGAAVADLKRDINSLRARFETELLSLGDPISGREKQSPPAEPTPQAVTPAQPEVSVKELPREPEAPPLPAENPEVTRVPEPRKSEAPAESESEKTYDASVKSLEEQLGLIPPSEDSAKSQAPVPETKPEEKKKRRWL